MKKSRFFLAVSFVSLLFVLLPAPAIADMWDVPVGPGETFRWVFVTSGTTNALSSDIGDYNTFVNAAADTAAANDPYGTTVTGVLGKDSIDDIVWKAIASTPTVNAIDNIVVSPASIFTPDGILVAYGTSDLFSEHHENPITTTEIGTTLERDVWTGSTTEGMMKGLTGQQALGGTGPGWTMGRNWYLLGGAWISYFPEFDITAQHPLYAISEELTVVPVPSALILGATGLLSATVGLKRLRRKHQE